MSRGQRLLAGLLVVQLVILLLLRAPWAGGSVKEHPLLPALAGMTPERLEIADGQGATMSLERDKGAWVLASPRGYPVTAGKADQLIQSVEHITVRRPVATSPRHHAALKVDYHDFERRLRLWPAAAGDKPAVELYVGTSPSATTTHIRVGGKNDVYETTGLTAFGLPADPTWWIERTLAPGAAQATTISLRNRSGSLTLAKTGNQWKLTSPAAHAALDTTGVATLGQTLSSLVIDRPAAEGDPHQQGLADPEAVVVFSGAPGVAADTVRIGGLVTGRPGERYVARSGFAWAVEVSQASAGRAVDASLASLTRKLEPAKKPGAPKPAAAGAKK